MTRLWRPLVGVEDIEDGCLLVVGVGDTHGPCVDHETKGLVEVGEDFLELLLADGFFDKGSLADEEGGGDSAGGGSFSDDRAKFSHDCVVDKSRLMARAGAVCAGVFGVRGGCLEGALCWARVLEGDFVNDG